MTSDIRMYHELKEHAKKMSQIFSFHEMRLYQQCIFYDYDSQAHEQGCLCTEINRGNRDFYADEECWLCDYYKPRSKKNG